MQDLENILSSLNPRQRQAVETIYGPVLVIAWPGSGKTQLLSARIAHILHETDYMPSNILCLTFTESAARNMRERLASMIGQDAYRVAIHTFHSFGNEILARYRYKIEWFEESKTIDDVSASRLLDTILEWLAWDDPYKPGYGAADTIRDLRGQISTLKSGGVTPEIFEGIIKSNEETLTKLSPLLSKYWEKIDTLWQKKEEKLEKIELFRRFTEEISSISVRERVVQTAWYDRLLSTISLSLESAWNEYEDDGKTTWMNNWRDAWTEKDGKWARIWKESGKIRKQKSLAHVYALYQKAMIEGGYIDFADMILRAIELVEWDEMVRANLAEQYQFVLIDEFQDTNEAQMRLVRSILSVSTESPNVFAVGDDDQSIYKFQGANIKNLRDFRDTYADTELIILDTNYRSCTEIIDISRAIVVRQLSEFENLFPWSEKSFVSARGDGAMTTKTKYTTELEEIGAIVKSIEAQIKSWVKSEDIAVIVKKNKSLEVLGKALLEKNIPVSMSKSESIWENELIGLIVKMVRYIDSLAGTYGKERWDILVEILAHPAWQIPRLTLWNLSKDIYHARKDETRSWIYTLVSHEDKSIKKIGAFLMELSLRASYTRLEDMIDLITWASSLSLPDDYDEDGEIDTLQLDIFGNGEKTDFTSSLYNYFFGQLWNHNSTKYSSHSERHLANIAKLVAHIRAYKWGKPLLTLHDMIDILDVVEKYAIPIETSHLIGNEDTGVSLITVHKAKWLEWDHVYVPFLHTREYKLGRVSGSTLPKNLPLEPEKDSDPDIERLIYTAYTRARDGLYVSWSEQSLDERANTPLPAIAPEDESWQDGEGGTEENSATLVLRADSSSLWSLPYIGDEDDFLRDRIDKLFVMNATALQNFLNVFDAGPEYFIANNILRFPGAKNIASSYGSAIHRGLEVFFTDYMQKWSFMKSLLFEGFEKSLTQEGFDTTTLTTYLDRGRANLESLYTEIVGRKYEKLFLEYDFRTVWGGVYLGDIQLTGKIDRIEQLGDDSLIITDYKTGGGFDTFDGKWGEYVKVKQWKYQLQLAFYAVLFDLSPRWAAFRQRQYELFFVEKNRDEDKFHKLTQYVQQGEVDRTKSLIRAVMSCIRDLRFPDVSKYPKSLEGIRQFEEDLLKNTL